MHIRKEYYMSNNNTIFDDVFRTMLEKMPQLVIPVINEVFHTSYSDKETIVQHRNEHHTKSGELITDSYLEIGGKLYHIECESKSGGNMCIRMIEYDFAVALEDASINPDRMYEIQFPHSCVLYLRHSANTPDTLKAKILLPDEQSFYYQIPTVKIQNYTRDEIFRKRLLFFLPFYILRYEKDLSNIAENFSQLNALVAEYHSLRLQLEQELSADAESDIYARLLELIERISNYVLRKKPVVKERIGDIMGGKVLELKVDVALDKGRKEGREEGREEVISRLLKYGMSVNEISAATGYSTEEILKIQSKI